MVLNNYVNILPEASVSQSTFTNVDAPLVQVRYFNPVFGLGDTVRIPYYVSDRYMEDKTKFELGKTFTTIIKFNRQTYKKTTFAGEQFIDIVSPSSEAETFFSIQCVEDNGVESSIQFFDVSVRSQRTYNTYQMKEADLATFGIVPGIVTDEQAYDNKAALSAFFAFVKGNGYNKVEMLPLVYYINYHAKVDGVYVTKNGGNNIVFPDDFTIDLNGATLTAVQSDDLNNGQIVELKENTNTHIVNGHIKSIYKGFDFQATKDNTGVTTPAEGIICARIVSSKYCSFDGLDISDSVGYELPFRVNVGTMVMNEHYHIAFEQKKFIDYEGNEVDSDIMMSGTTYIQLVSGYDELVVGRPLGYGGYFGSQREIFMSFYDGQYGFLCTIKSKQQWLVKIPENAAFVRVSAYGTSEQLNVAYPGGLAVYYMHLSKNCEVKNCTIRDTRTVGFAPCSGNHILFKNNAYYNIANERVWYVTKLFGDIEDSWQYCRNIYFFDNELRYGDTATFVVYYATNFNFIGNKGISPDLRGGMEGMYFANNYMEKLGVDFNNKSYHPQFFFKSNVIGRLTVTTTSSTEENDMNIPMENCTLVDQNDSPLLIFRNCKNGIN